MASTSDLNINFDLVEVGVSGSFEVVPKVDRSKERIQLPLKTVPLGLPPVLPKIEDEFEKFLFNLEDLPIHDVDRAQKFIPRVAEPLDLLHTDVTSLQTTIQVERNPTTGQLLGYKEEYLPDMGKTAQNSLSLQRAPDPTSAGDVRGSSLNFPFWPGGQVEPELESLLKATENVDIDFENDLLTVAPGLPEGMTFSAAVQKQQAEQTKSLEEQPKVMTLADIMTLGDDLDDLDVGDDEEFEKATEDTKVPAKETIELQRSESLEKLVDTPSDKTTEVVTAPVRKEEPKEEWAINIDVNQPVDDFYKRIPDMAYKWPFEPDVFQKQAILHLESHDSVFVAAHTSAGKTVVAEYAIALSLKHMTRTVYTSPIKALSNQKYRDFKLTFSDVGLITGDVQINQTAACLIMTTEILRSMLYNGSDVIRDLEWVIFDEVHYINDAERGVVWEEVLIMLPQHVNIILLSATVPNTLEFAAWIGRTKKKKIYVISTTKRPVPLEHFLYTGNSNKTSNELFRIVDAKGSFSTTGYQKAIDAKKERATKSSQSFGAKGTRGGHPNQDKNVWLSVIDMLKKKEKLPVVAFTFSKKKIDENATNLHSLDLTTAKEKSEIHIFFHSSIKKLKGSDQQLPQVLQMEDTLKRGIGVHHSGILPILKEVVELLFQKGLVKILFATETFAMGVNMPARTVVFDSIRKHDGTHFRDLLPGEYIQMAGRAGRRGLDTTGTVIILCKGDVPEVSSLHKMMLGKPTKLESRFRLTYSMILNLLRVEQLRVEDMMKRSFSEFHSQKDVARRKEDLQVLHKKLSTLEDIECFMCSVDLEPYWEACRDYHDLQKHLQGIILSHPAAVKALSPGRVVIMNHEIDNSVLGVVLKTSSGANNERNFNILIICDKNNDSAKNSETSKNTSSAINSNNSLESDAVKPVIKTKLFQPEGPCWHEMVQCKADSIAIVTTKTIRTDGEKVINDIKKREQPRFRNDPPSQSVTTATQELLRMTEANSNGLPGLDPIKDLHLRDIELVEKFRSLELMKDKFLSYNCVNCPRFTEHFSQISSNMKLKEDYRRLQFLLSDASLTLLPEYQQRVEVLKALNYIDEHNAVQLKGRVACEISTHELMITELVFENAFTDLHPTEIAALLSSMVFEQKNCSEPRLIDTLEKGRDRILEKAAEISQKQKKVGMQVDSEYEETFKFGLMEVVFEWARGMPFSEITNLTDVQEGIIVRCIQRLHETLRDVRNAARIIGDPVLYQKMEEASSMIKRDIVFAASLYTQ
ncbi:SKI2 subunit of superkiller complex protein-like [Mercenaria mercenaria]|uniref:SKI2 subunit of superkiller complex protein-like n=1 Tax=Mercenaria mercenaria TaxID=6596 RepID=UPI00234F9EE1|nr:SKI2 subunit of superkiller complex protein-like [Mercenaria mercenaria]XP_045196098.2 SKI2 subunit of superkiller complex protein-like [Mercenaria mercenaria]